MVSAEFQSVATIDDVTTGTIPPGQEVTVTAPTICDDLSTVAAPPGTGETGAGTSYDVGSVSLESVRTMDNIVDLAENGNLHNEQLGMSLDSYVPTIAQVERWIRAGELAGTPYTWEVLRSSLSSRLAVALGKKPSEQELDACIETVKLDISQLRTKEVAPSDSLLSKVIGLQNNIRTQGLGLSEAEITAAVEKLSAAEELISQGGKNVASLTKEQLIAELERKITQTGLQLNETSLKVLVAGRCAGSYGCGSG